MGITVSLMLCTLTGMISSFNNFSSVEAGSASTLAQSIESALGPMTIGGPIFIVGLTLLLVGWWRGRETQRSEIG